MRYSSSQEGEGRGKLPRPKCWITPGPASPQEGRNHTGSLLSFFVSIPHKTPVGKIGPLCFFLSFNIQNKNMNASASSYISFVAIWYTSSINLVHIPAFETLTTMVRRHLVGGIRATTDTQRNATSCRQFRFVGIDSLHRLQACILPGLSSTSGLVC